MIYTTLTTLLKQKSFQRITVSDIQRVSSVSRATFYRHFDHLTDVLAWRCEQYFAEMFSNYHGSTENTYKFIHYLLEYWFFHHEILEILVNIHRIDIIYECHLNCFKSFIEQRILTQIPLEDYDYAMGIRSGMMVGILFVWLKGRKKTIAGRIVVYYTKTSGIFKAKQFFGMIKSRKLLQKENFKNAILLYNLVITTKREVAR